MLFLALPIPAEIVQPSVLPARVQLLSAQEALARLTTTPTTALVSRPVRIILTRSVDNA